MTHLAQQQQSSAMMIHPCPAPRGFIHLFRFGHIHIVLGLIPITSISISRVSPILASSRALLAFFFRKKNRNHQHHHHHPYYSSYCTIKKKKKAWQTWVGGWIDILFLSVTVDGWTRNSDSALIEIYLVLVVYQADQSTASGFFLVFGGTWFTVLWARNYWG